MLGPWVLGCIGCLAPLLWGGEATGVISQFPDQFSARLQITSHMVDRTTAYPARMREMDVVYDKTSGRAKVALREGFNAGKTFFRLYGSNQEYMIREGEYPTCRRSYLGETMPPPELPLTASFQDMQMLEGSLCEHWFQDDGVSRLHIFIESATQVPRRLTEETVRGDTAAVPLVTYDFLDFKVGPQAQELFVLPEQYLAREACDFHVGGFPYIHLFHHYLRV